MIHHFAFRTRARRPGARGGAQPPAHSPGPGHTPEPDHGGIAHVLTALIGREVTLVTDGGLLSGRLLHADPVTLTGPAGEAICLSPAQIRSVEF